ncbi:unnamed protein product [Caenorhabditis angaria]|uniref:Protein kinase domain-containing protein n=1 Tax=Caenorhabditis angaria TaxID=860376 RepID=A0A9P1IL89_9PELO|nr:unnamed protein product [Caenorhabditis angaria]
MGNYKSRPLTSCSDELKKKISEGYSVVRSRLNDDIRPRTTTGWNELQIAAFEKSPEDFKNLLKLENVESTSSQSLTLVHIICAGHSNSQCQKLQSIFEILEEDRKKSLISSISSNGFSALHIAIYKGDKDLVSFLISSEVDLNQSGRHKLPPLHLASMTGDVDILTLLLDGGADIHSTDFVHFTSLHCATYFSNENIVRVLLSRGADANLGGAVNDRPIHLAAAKGLAAISKLLLDSKADPLLADDEGNQSLHYAAKSANLTVLNLLLKYVRGNHERICARNLYGDTALHLACYSGRLDVVKTLLECSPTNIVNLENVFSETALHAASTGGKSIELVAFLCKYPGVDPNYQGQDGHTALHSACYHGHLRIVQYLLENGADQSLASRAFEGGALRQQAGNSVGARMSKVASAIMALNRSDTPSSNASYNSTISIDDQQTPVIWAYERGHDAIVALLKHYANRTTEGDVCSEYSSGESSYTPLPSPMGRLTSLTRDKAELLQLRSALPAPFHLCLAEVDFQESIGAGSFGKVYKGTYRGKLVAVKRYRAMAFGCKSETDMLCREVSILSRLSHPNIVAFVGTSLDDPSQFAIVTEFVENGSLFHLLHEEKRVLDPDFRLRVSLDIARGMLYLHESAAKPVIHRDLNSHNILIHNDGRSVVADFGESRFASQRENENLTKQPGNLRWMAPEVFSQSGKYDRKVDVFSFGLVVWEIHTAELPFANLKPAAAAAEMTYKRGRPTLPNQPTPQFPAHILNLIPQAWHPEPEFRPEFSQIVTLLEPHVVDAHTDILAPSTVSQLKTQWEQLSIAPPPRQGFPPMLSSLHGISSSGTVEELRQRIDSNGYVINK